MSVLDWLKSVALLSVILFFGVGSYLLWETTRIEKQLSIQASSFIVHADKVLDQADTSLRNTDRVVSKTGDSIHGVIAQASGVVSSATKTFEIVNHPCIPGPCGTLYDFSKTLNTTRLTLGQVENAANHEDKNLGKLDAQETQLFLDTHAALSGFVPIQSDIDRIVLDADAFLKSSDLTGSVHNFNTITYNVGQTTGDFQNKFHAFLYPPPCHGFDCFVKKGYETVKIGSQLMEPAYYFWAITSGVRP